MNSNPQPLPDVKSSGFSINIDEGEELYDDVIPKANTSFKAPLFAGQALIKLNRSERRAQTQKKRKNRIDHDTGNMIVGTRSEGKRQARKNWEARRELERERDQKTREAKRNASNVRP